MDSSTVGRFGSISLLKQRSDDAIVCSYPIDAELLTIGRDPACDIRLYYEAVSALHCKIIFEERKAFLIVLGQNGLLIDGCPVFPAPPSASRPNTIPLTNHSLIEIHNKRFRFAYPPKELRAALIATPTGEPVRRRALRLSMIQSAQVFSPRPSKNPLENLRVLQSPLRPAFATPARRRNSSPLKHKGTVVPEEDEEEEEEEEIVLVEGNHPRVLQEEKDLVILEDVEVRALTRANAASPAPVFQLGQSQEEGQQRVQKQAMQTPRRKTGRPSLHRAVLIRSAQRAVMRAEIEREDEEEEMEVENIMEVEEEDEDIGLEDAEGGSGEDANMDMEDEEEDREDEEGQQVEGPKPVGWRKSLTELWPFGRKAEDQSEEDEREQESQDAAALERAPEEDADIDEEDEDGSQDSNSSTEDEESEAADISPGTPVPPLRALGRFMTPQFQRTAFTSAAPATSRAPRGRTPSGGNPAMTPRRAEAPWKVRDILVPLTDKEEPTAQLQLRPAGERRLSEEEAKAIRDRRRSALLAPDTFGTPRAAPASPSPFTAGTAAPAPPSPSKLASPTKLPPSSPMKTSRADDDTDEEDTAAMLASVRRTVESMRRRSLGHRDGLAVAGTPVHAPTTSARKRGKFSLIAHNSEEKIGALDFGAPSDDEDDDGMGTTDDERAQKVGAPAGDSEQEESDKENDVVGGNGAVDEAGPEKDADDNMVVEPQDEDEDEEETDEQSTGSPTASSSRLPPQTPNLAGLKHVFTQPRDMDTPAFTGMRELFKEPAGNVQTPRMGGVRDMYLRERPAELGTPVYDGIGDMLATPTGYRAEDLEEADEAGTLLEQPAVAKKPQPKHGAAKSNAKPTGAAANSRLPARTTKPRAPPLPSRRAAPAGSKVPGDASMADDEMTPAEPVLKRATASRLAVPKAAIVRRTKMKVEVAIEEPSAPAKVTKSRIVKTTRVIPAAATTEESDQAEEDQEAEHSAAAPIRRARAAPPAQTTTKSTVKTPVEQPRDAEPVGPKTAPRRGRVRTTEDDQAATTPVAAPAPTRRATRATPLGSDVLDVPAPGTSAKGKRVTRSKPVENASKEEDSDVVPEPKAATRAAAKRPAAAKPPAPSKLPAPAAPTATRTRASARKATSAGSGAEEAVNKENTPESREDSGSELPASGKPAAVKVTRTKRAGAGTKTPTVKDEEATVEVPRTTRATRTRAKK